MFSFLFGFMLILCFYLKCKPKTGISDDNDSSTSQSLGNASNLTMKNDKVNIPKELKSHHSLPFIRI